MKNAINRASLRAELSTYSPEELSEGLEVVAQASAEFARELQIPLQQFVALLVEAYAEAHGKYLTTFEYSEDEKVGNTVLVGITGKMEMS